MSQGLVDRLLRIDIRDTLTVTNANGVDLTPRGRKARALIFYLLRKPDHIETRRNLTSLLWSDRAEEQARQSLRQTLYELRFLMDRSAPLLAADRFIVRLDRAYLVEMPQDQASRAIAAPLVHDLDGLSPAFDRWLDQEKQRAGSMPGGDGSDGVAAGRTPDLDIGGIGNESGPPPRRRWRTRGVVAGSLLALGSITIGAVGWHAHAERQRVIFVQPMVAARGDGPASRLSQDLVSDLSRAVLGHDATLRFADAENAAPPVAAFNVGGKVVTINNDVQAVVTISEGNNPAILWSQDYTAPIGDASGIRQQISTNLAAVLVCALGARGVPDQIDAQATALYLEACSLHAGDQMKVAYLLRQVTERAPQFAGGWADLAISLAFVSQDSAPDVVAGTRSEADAAAGRALALDPRQGNAYYARALLMPDLRNWVARERMVGAGLDVEPDNPQLYNLHATDLAEVGREKEGVAAFRRAVALDPLFPGKTASLIRALTNAGKLDDAKEALARMQEIWPDSPLTWHAKFAFAARLGDPRVAEAMLADNRRRQMEDGEARAWKDFLAARADPTRAHVQTAIAALQRWRRQGVVSDVQLVTDLTLLGQPDKALDIALHLPPQDGLDWLFRSFLSPLRANPRFLDVAKTQGLLAIWQATGQWPDFCTDERLSYDCRAVAAGITSAARPAEMKAGKIHSNRTSRATPV